MALNLLAWPRKKAVRPASRRRFQPGAPHVDTYRLETRALMVALGPVWAGNWNTNLGPMSFTPFLHGPRISMDASLANPNANAGATPEGNVMGTTLTGFFYRYAAGGSSKKTIVGGYTIKLSAGLTSDGSSMFVGTYNLKTTTGANTKGAFRGTFVDCPDGSHGAYQLGCDMAAKQLTLKVGLDDVGTVSHYNAGARVVYTATVKNLGPFALPAGRAEFGITIRVNDSNQVQFSDPVRGLPFRIVKTYDSDSKPVVRIVGTLPALKSGQHVTLKFGLKAFVNSYGNAGPSLTLDADIFSLVDERAKPTFQANGQRSRVGVGS